jgi:hypothetical protein
MLQYLSMLYWEVQIAIVLKSSIVLVDHCQFQIEYISRSFVVSHLYFPYYGPHISNNYHLTWKKMSVSLRQLIDIKPKLFLQCLHYPWLIDRTSLILLHLIKILDICIRIHTKNARWVDKVTSANINEIIYAVVQISLMSSFFYLTYR